jgi:hypothetical protein
MKQASTLITTAVVCRYVYNKPWQQRLNGSAVYWAQTSPLPTQYSGKYKPHPQYRR